MNSRPRRSSTTRRRRLGDARDSRLEQGRAGEVELAAERDRPRRGSTSGCRERWATPRKPERRRAPGKDAAMPRLRRADCSGPGIRRRRARPGLRLRRRRRRPRSTSRRCCARIAELGDPAGLGGRVDLPVPARPPAGDGHRRRRAQAVPLPRRLARAARRRRSSTTWSRFARALPELRERVEADLGDCDRLDRALRAGAAPCACSSAASSASAPRSTRSRTSPTASRRCARTHVRVEAGRRDGLRLPGQERPAARAGRRRTSSARRGRRRRSSGGAAAAPSCSPTRSAGAGATCAPRTSTRYLKEATGGDFSAKDFRTWNATVLAAVALGVSGEVGGHPDRPQARGQPRDRRGRALPRQHAGRLPRLLHRPARVRRLPGGARRSARALERVAARLRAGRAADPPAARSRRPCSTCSTSARSRGPWSGSRRSALPAAAAGPASAAATARP